jgi:hypothetical protein
MKSPVSSRVRDKIFHLGFRHQRLYRAYQAARRAAVFVFELGGRSEASEPPWAIDWHLWVPNDKGDGCRTCGLKDVAPGTLHRALDRAESDAADTVLTDPMTGGAGWVIGVSYRGQAVVPKASRAAPENGVATG